MTAAVFVRHAATSLAEGKITAGLPALPAGIVAQIERMYRGVYLLATLKRDEMIGEGRQEEPTGSEKPPATLRMRSWTTAESID